MLIKFIKHPEADIHKLTDQHGAKKLLLISLDGLSAEQFQYLSKTFGFLVGFTGNTLSQFTSGTLNTPQAIWGEILSGQHWWETGCAGYAYPRTSLNDLEISSESLHQFQSVLPGKSDLCVNVPLLEPNSKRLWLSDGSNSSDAISPKTLLGKEPFKSYRPRPFSSPAYFRGNETKGSQLAMECERQRLDCAMELAKDNNWQAAIVRLSAFDHLSHLLGSNFLIDEKLKIRADIESFIAYANQTLETIASNSHGATICLMSAFSHSECKRRVNLNLLLSQLGYLTIAPKSVATQSLNLRQKVTLTLSQKPETSYLPSALVSTANYFDETSSIAASPIHGAIYINAKQRFKNGVVEPQDIERKKREIASAIREALNDAGIEDITIEPNPKPSNSLAPDLMILAANTDFHSLYDAPAIDNFSHPLTCHAPKGFVCIKDHAAHDLDPISLNKLLVECRK